MNALILNGILLQVVYLAIMVFIVQKKQDTSIANFTWGGGVMLTALYTLLVGGTFFARQLLLTGMTLIWGTRLALYVYLRYKGNDPRFQAWKHEGGLKALTLNLGYIFGLQALLLLIMSVPVYLVNTMSGPGLNLLDLLGFVVWAVGFYFESVSDYQLFRFTSDPLTRGKVMKSGLWHYSRHPNYFGEVTMWWGIYMIALSVPNGWLAVIAPVTITFLLLFVTGIPWVERAFENNPEYQEYKRKTSIFIPWFTRE